MHVNARLGKILDSACVIEVEMRQHDVAYVARREAERLDLAQRGVLLAVVDIEHRRP